MPEDPTDADVDAWERFGYCCACLGCEDHAHVCARSDEERAGILREHDEAITIMLTKGAGHHGRSDGSEITVYRGPSDPEYPKGEGFDGPAWNR